MREGWEISDLARVLISLGASDSFLRLGHPEATEKFRQVREYWRPYIVAELNAQRVKLDKLKGEFIWHHHDNEDEMFLVMKGGFRIDFRDGGVARGEFIVLPRGLEHRPVAEEEAHVLLFEPESTLNTGNVRDERTLEKLERIRTRVGA